MAKLSAQAKELLTYQGSQNALAEMFHELRDCPAEPGSREWGNAQGCALRTLSTMVDLYHKDREAKDRAKIIKSDKQISESLTRRHGGLNRSSTAVPLSLPKGPTTH